MFSTAKYLLTNKKLLETISYTVQKASLLHVCTNHHLVSKRKLLSALRDKKGVALSIEPIYAARLISTKDASVQVSLDNVLDTTKNASSPPISKSVASSEPVKSSSAVEGIPEVSTAEAIDIPIPEPPEPIDISQLLVDADFHKLGLGGWTPVGWIQNGFEILNVTLGLPWWECILISTALIRIALFPLVIIQQKSTVTIQNNQPTFQELQLKMNEARQRGDNMEAAQLSQDLMLFMKEKHINPIKNMIVPLCQAPVFISFFMGLREMANIPLKSMHSGGIFWFSDLTVPDQFYLLPVITSLTMLLSIEIGGSTSKVTNQNLYLVRYLFRAVPFVMLPFTINFPSAILLYWTINNLISLTQVSLFTLPKVRTFFNIPQRIDHDPGKLPFQPKGFVKEIKTWWKDTKIVNQHADRGKKSIMTFNTAGRGAVPKTYKYNPTLPRNSD